ncbi:hypothetical protein B0H12DRAFT_1125735 [Mycena haematopus]|nr:hypothetical protein B0H12DRAFT_1125735 [Mycena haematopus]
MGNSRIRFVVDLRRNESRSTDSRAGFPMCRAFGNWVCGRQEGWIPGYSGIVRLER